MDCLVAMWIWRRFGNAPDAALQFVPAGRTFQDQIVDSDPAIIHVDTGGGRFDHHDVIGKDLCAAELVRREVNAGDPALKRIVDAVIRIDHALDIPKGSGLTLVDLIRGYNALYPNEPQRVAEAMFHNFDAWYAHEEQQSRQEDAFERRIEFYTPWGPAIALQSNEGCSGRLAFRQGAVLYIYRDGRGYTGIVARSDSDIDLQDTLDAILRIEPDADWYLHPSHRMLLCGTSKAPPRQISRLTIRELVRILEQ